MSYKITNRYFFSIFLKLLLLLILYTVDVSASRPCERECGGISIPFPFGIGNDCYFDEYYEVECRNTSRKLVPFLSFTSQEVVSIILPNQETSFGSESFGDTVNRQYGIVRVKRRITSTGCSTDGKELVGGSLMNLTGGPFFSDGLNMLTAVGCNSKVSLTHIKPNTVVCELSCNTSRDSHIINNIPFFNMTGCSMDLFPNPYDSRQVCTEEDMKETECDGNGCCQVVLPNTPQQVVGIGIESSDENSTSCRVAFLTDEVYNLPNGTEPQDMFHKGYATVSLGWVIQTRNHSLLKAFPCRFGRDNGNITTYSETKCTCGKSISSGTSYANCECDKGYSGNPYDPDGCKDTDECKTIPELCGKGGTCRNTIGGYRCVGDRSKAVLIGVGAGFGVLVLIGGLWWMRKFVIKRRMTQRKKRFFKRNGGILLQQELNTSEANVEKTRIFSSRELEKATENFSENRVLGHGGQGTVYKGMLVDGRTVAVKKSKVVDGGTTTPPKVYF